MDSIHAEREAEFRSQNRDLAIAWPGCHIEFRPRNDGPLQAALVLTADATSRHIRAAASAVGEWNKRLRAWQSTPDHDRDTFLDYLSELQQAGMSPKRIADKLNALIVALLHSYVGYLRRIAPFLDKGLTLREWFALGLPPPPLPTTLQGQVDALLSPYNATPYLDAADIDDENSAGLTNALEILRLLHRPMDEVEATCRAIIDNLWKNRPAYTPGGGPVETTVIREMLRAYRAKRRDGESRS